jgi:hypothetical protein
MSIMKITTNSWLKRFMASALLVAFFFMVLGMANTLSGDIGFSVSPVFAVSQLLAFGGGGDGGSGGESGGGCCGGDNNSGGSSQNDSSSGGSEGGSNSYEAPPVPPAPEPAPVCTLTVSPKSIAKGEAVTVSWTSQNATSGTLTPVSGGSHTMYPETDTTYTSNFEGPGGSVTCSDSVTVKTPPPPTHVPKKPLCTLTAQPYLITQGESTKLLWTSQNATSGSIDNGVGNISPIASGSVTVSPTSDTTYTATFVGDGGAVICTKTILVKKDPNWCPAPPKKPVCTLKASVSEVTLGENNVTLSWTSDNASSGSMNESVGNLTPVTSGSVSVTPSQTTTYTATFLGAEHQTITCSAKIKVKVPAKVPVCALTVSPHTVSEGESVTISWTSANVDAGSIDHGIGSLSPVTSGSLTAFPPFSKTYTATFTGPHGMVTCSDSVEVVKVPPKVPLCTLDASPLTIEKGAATTLSWTSTNVSSGSIDNGVGNLSAVVSGSVTVSPNADTTYTASFTGVNGSISCSAVVDVQTGGGGGDPRPACTLTASPRDISQGENVTLTWSSARVESGSINNGVGTITPVSGGLVTVSVDDDKTFTAEFTGPNGSVSCSDSVNVDGGGGGGGGSSKPRVTLSLKSSQDPLTFVTLTEIPYTGFETGPVGMVLFWSALIVASGMLAYGISLKGWGSEWFAKLSALLSAPERTAYVAHATQPFEDLGGVSAVRMNHFDADAVYNNMRGVTLSALAEAVPIMHRDVSSREDVFDANMGASAIPENLPVHPEDDATNFVAPAFSKNLYETLEHAAHNAGVLLSQEALEFIVGRSHGDALAGELLLSELMGKARESYPREDGWLHLNHARVLDLLGEAPIVTPATALSTEETTPTPAALLRAEAIPVAASSAVRVSTLDTTARSATQTFVTWMCEGASGRVFEFLRQLKREGASTREFLSSVVALFDEVHRERLEGGRTVDAQVLSSMQTLTPADIEAVIDLLSVGFDYSYADEHGAVKTALLRATDYLSKGTKRAQ